MVSGKRWKRRSRRDNSLMTDRVRSRGYCNPSKSLSRSLRLTMILTKRKSRLFKKPITKSCSEYRRLSLSNRAHGIPQQEDFHLRGSFKSRTMGVASSTRSSTPIESNNKIEQGYIGFHMGPAWLIRGRATQNKTASTTSR